MPIHGRSAYISGVFRRWATLTFRFGMGQVLGMIVTLGILLLQIRLGMVPMHWTGPAVLSVSAPYLVLIIMGSVFSLFRAFYAVDCDRLDAIAAAETENEILLAQLNRFDRTLEEELRRKTTPLSDSAKKILLFLLRSGGAEGQTLRFGCGPDISGLPELQRTGLIEVKREFSGATVRGRYYFILEGYRDTLKSLFPMDVPK